MARHTVAGCAAYRRAGPFILYDFPGHPSIVHLEHYQGMGNDLNTTWRTSSYSGDNGNCVEVATGETVLVRDTKNRAAGRLTVQAAAWRAFLTEVSQPR